MYVSGFLTFLVSFFYSVLIFAQVTPDLLSQQTLERFNRVPEFNFIIQEANKLGIKVYLFGGTASAFAHYVRWDLEREAGDPKYQPERFDYDFTNIYRGNQDLDIVVDGTSEQADQLQRVLQKEYPHFIGDRTAWEIRLLKESRGDKRALLGDEDFKKQHSDTNSTGMLLLNPDPNGIVYNDLLNWGSEKSEFLSDVAKAEIKFLFRKEHETTDRFKKGLNPPILAAIRYLAKLAQYEVKGTPEDLEIVKKIISQTDFQNLTDYGKKKAGEFALKTLLNAPNSEYAWNLLEETGVRIKLVEMDKKNSDQQNSISWWLNKEPLRSRPLGNKGKKVSEIFSSLPVIVSHETNSFIAYDNITRSSQGFANTFISRQGILGETAYYGDGFYTRIGQEGARGTGLTIRFELHPDARLEEDFILANDFIIVTNKNALTLKQENLNLIDFLMLLKSGDLNGQDKGLLEKFKRKFNRMLYNPKEFYEAFEFIKKAYYIEGLQKEDQYDFDEQSHHFDRLVHLLIVERQRFHELILSKLVDYPKKEKLNILKQIRNEGLVGEDYIITHHLHKDYWKDSPEVIQRLIDKDIHIPELIEHVLSLPQWWHRSDWIELILKNPKYHQDLIREVFSKEGYHVKEEWVQLIIKSDQAHSTLITHVISKSPWSERKDIIQELMYTSNTVHIPLSIHVFSKEYWVQHPEFIDKLVKSDYLTPYATQVLIQQVLAKPYWSHRTDWVDHLIKNRVNHKLLVQNLFSTPYFDLKPEWLKILISDFNIYDDVNIYVWIVKYVFSKKHAVKNTDDLKPFLKEDFLIPHILEYVFSEPYWKNTAQSWLEKNIHNSEYDIFIAQHILSQEHFSDRVDWLQLLIERGTVDQALIVHVFSKKFWTSQDQLLEKLLQKENTAELALRHIFSEKHWAHKHNLVNSFLTNERESTRLATYLKLLAFPIHVKNTLAQQIINTGNELAIETLIHVFFDPKLTQHVQFMHQILDQNRIIELHKIIAKKLMVPADKTHSPEIVEKLLQKETLDTETKKELLSAFHWKSHSEFIEYLGGLPVTLENWQAQKISFSEWKKTKHASPLQCSTLL